MRCAAQGDAEFNVEVHLLSRLRHPHLVRLVGVCVEGSHRAAVFELMLGGCLRTALDAGPTRGVPSSAAKPLPRHPLTWLARLNIALGAAAGLAFLHEVGGDRPPSMKRVPSIHAQQLGIVAVQHVLDVKMGRHAAHWLSREDGAGPWRQQ